MKKHKNNMSKVTPQKSGSLSKKNGKNCLVSIVIPVKNGMPYFSKVLNSLANQKLNNDFDVIIIDSGSNDGSLEKARSMDERFRVVEIEPSEFGHGKTRNLGVSLSNSRFCAFLTHDAMPVDDQWLSRLIEPMLRDNRVAGVFSRHEAYPNADAYTKHELEKHFEGLAQWPVVQLTDARKYAFDEGLRKAYHFYSDNSSCLRKSVWKRIPYPEIDFAEDQFWAKMVVEAGYKKAFAINSVVYHSHDYSITERFRRSYDEARALRELFGYKYICSKREMMKTWIWLTYRDLSLGFAKGWWWRHFVSVLARPFHNFSKVLGQYLGTTNPNFVSKHENVVSRDRALRTLHTKPISEIE